MEQHLHHHPLLAPVHSPITCPAALTGTVLEDPLRIVSAITSVDPLVTAAGILMSLVHEIFQLAMTHTFSLPTISLFVEWTPMAQIW